MTKHVITEKFLEKCPNCGAAECSARALRSANSKGGAVLDFSEHLRYTVNCSQTTAGRVD